MLASEGAACGADAASPRGVHSGTSGSATIEQRGQLTRRNGVGLSHRQPHQVQTRSAPFAFAVASAGVVGTSPSPLAAGVGAAIAPPSGGAGAFPAAVAERPRAT